MKKLFLYLLPACFFATTGFAQHDVNNINLIKEDPEGIIDHTPLPRLDKVDDMESQYILLDNTSGYYSPKEWKEMPRRIDFFQNEKALDNTPYLPKRKYDPWQKKWLKS